MRLVNDIMVKVLEYYNEFDVNNLYELAVWKFYKLYSIACSITGFTDYNLKEKEGRIRQLLINPNQRNYAKIKEFMKQDMRIIDEAFRVLEKNKEEQGYFGDLYQKGTIAISINE